MAKCRTCKGKGTGDEGGCSSCGVEKFYEWTIKVRVAASWVSDGFDLTAERAHDMVSSDLSFAHHHEIETEIVSAPTRDEIAKQQGYTGVDDPRWQEG